MALTLCRQTLWLPTASQSALHIQGFHWPCGTVECLLRSHASVRSCSSNLCGSGSTVFHFYWRICHILFIHYQRIFGPFLVLLGQTFMYKILRGHVFSFLLGIYVGVKFLGSLVTPYFTAKLFSKLAALFFASTSRYMKFHMKPLSPPLVITLPKWVWSGILLSLWFAFPEWLWTPLYLLIGLLYMFGKVFKSFACFLVGLSFTGKLWEFFVYSESVSLIGYII